MQQVTTKDPKKIEQGKTEHNRRKREQMKAQRESETNFTYYGAGVVVATGVLGVISYYIYQSKTSKDKPKDSPFHLPKEAPVHQTKETPDKFNMD